jgi:hypothetical protein
MGRLVLARNTVLKIHSCMRASVRALAVFGEGIFHVLPSDDRFFGQSVNPSSSCSRKHNREISDCDQAVAVGNLDSVSMILEPGVWFGYTVVSLNVLRETELRQVNLDADVWAMAPRSHIGLILSLSELIDFLLD